MKGRKTVMKKTCCLLLFILLITQLYGCSNHAPEDLSAPKNDRTKTSSTIASENTNATNAAPIESFDIQQEIDDYMMHFINLYSTNAMNNSDSLMRIEEFETELGNDGSTATLVKYLDNENRCLRYRVELYGETMNTVINYYLCEKFVLISKQKNYYSSQILQAGWDDILYSDTQRWILWNDRIYTFSDNGEGDVQLKEIDKEQLEKEIPMIDEIESCEPIQD